MLEKKTGIKRVIYATYYSYKGTLYNVIHESAFRQEFVASLVLIPLACWLNVTLIERLLMIMTLLIVLIAELLNTAVEAAIDRISFDVHELSGIAKDAGSAAVFFSLLMCAMVWISVVYVNFI